MNAVEIEQAISDLAEHPFDRVEFPYVYDLKAAKLVKAVEAGGA